MTPALRTARWLTAAATLSSATAAYLTATGWYWSAAGTVYVASLLAWCANREYAHARRARYRAQLAERAARGESIDDAVFAVVPCCDLSTHADGRSHGADCLRPPDPFAELDAACCAEGFISFGVAHDSTCPTRTTRSAA
jgi:ABC-type nickel/cobalt efflux system permease component RcnA